jgi:hypothetical protein
LFKKGINLTLVFYKHLGGGKGAGPVKLVCRVDLQGFPFREGL